MLRIIGVDTVPGEQSTGKSYALNHLVDTSFAGSAMRCTEGVWLSMTPTNDGLIVALDFEGVSAPFWPETLLLTPPLWTGIHSIERSAQEDMLLVLFNTALSNLVYIYHILRSTHHEIHSIDRSSSVIILPCRGILQACSRYVIPLLLPPVHPFPFPFSTELPGIHVCPRPCKQPQSVPINIGNYHKGTVLIVLISEYPVVYY